MEIDKTRTLNHEWMAQAKGSFRENRSTGRPNPKRGTRQKEKRGVEACCHSVILAVFEKILQLRPRNPS